MLLRTFLCLLVIHCCSVHGRWDDGKGDCDDWKDCKDCDDCVHCDNCDCKQCGPNEVWTEHVIPCPPQICAANGKIFHCPNIETDNEPPGCICEDGYLRNKYGVCIPSDDCPPDCKECRPNEVWTEHVIPCPPQTCAAKGIIFFCPRIIPEDEPPGCICKKGYLRNKDGVCIPSDDCPHNGCNGDPNAHPGCGLNCGRTCADYKDPPCDCDERIGCIEHGCDCNDGYVKDPNVGKCVKPDDCTPTCKEYEVYNSCGTACQPYCDDRSPNCTAPCVPGCFCEPGYIRKHDEGLCIKLEKCESCNGDPNARPGCGNPCGHTCADVGKPSHPCPLYCLAHGCDCVEGYVLDTNIHKCVKPCDCPPVCGVNETYSLHPVTCPPDTCDAIGEGFACPANTTSDTPACVCNDGYYRNKKNQCVLQEDCDSCRGDPNARPGCGISRGHTCADYDQPIDTEPHSCAANGCDCAEGYVLDENTNKCVKPCDCTPTCGSNETYTLNPVICPPETCDAIGGSFACPANSTSDIPACVCLGGYYRNKDNECVLKADCDSCDGDPNAHPGCGHTHGRTCADRDKEPCGCPTKTDCPGFCDCKDGYWFNTENHKCVLPCDCPWS